jgi:hypothetical protein
VVSVTVLANSHCKLLKFLQHVRYLAYQVVVVCLWSGPVAEGGPRENLITFSSYL